MVGSIMFLEEVDETAGGFEVREEVLLRDVVVVRALIVCAIIIHRVVDAHFLAVKQELGIPKEVFGVVDAFLEENLMFHDEGTLVESSPKTVVDDILADEEL